MPPSSNSARPVILALAGEEADRVRLAEELSSRYARDYLVVAVEDAQSARRRLAALVESGHPVALVLADNRAGGAAFLRDAHQLDNHARRGLLIRWYENRAAREELTRDISTGAADYFVALPTDPPDEPFHRAITEFLHEWWQLRGTPFQAVRVIAPEGSIRAHEICDLLARHDLPYGRYDADSPEGKRLLAEASVEDATRPVLILPSGQPLVDPTNTEAAEAIGARTHPREGVYDTIVVGGGPAGLAAAVSAASEGLRTSLVERVALGGQAGTSSMIRNYLGFPRGISGAELAARAVDQALLFGADVVYGREAVSLSAEGDLRVVELRDGTRIPGRSVIIATGVSYRRLGVPELERFEGVGLFYGAATSEARLLAGEPVVVVGGGNSAGQAAMHLSRFASQVTMLVRSPSLAQSMSDYLVRDIDAAPNVDVRFETELIGGSGTEHVEWVTIRDRRTGSSSRLTTTAVFALIGAEPFTGWLPEAVLRDEWGYVVTGLECAMWPGGTGHGPPASRGDLPSGVPAPFETSLPGVFAVGDVRRGSIKRVASAAGDGAIVVRLVHDYLAERPAASVRGVDQSAWSARLKPS